ncbi:MAG: hypothetical protein JRE38_11170 [Deltaproteobacteria bacterium]|nr:hypothetical protein [Deltaproteobacteria bacterium]MBW2691351.1 hypothetical protein [Deltaproteobacteria bacterium]
MMNKKKIALILLGLAVAAFVLFRPSFTTIHILYDDEIDPVLRSQMQMNSLMVLNALRDEEYDVVLSFFGRRSGSEEIRNALPAARDKMGSLIESAKFKNFHDHYVTGLAGTETGNTVMSAHALTDEPGAYFVYQNTDTQNAYVSLFTSEVSQTEALYTIVWGEYEDGWKIHNFDIASFGWSGKRGPDWFEEAQKVREKSGDVAAYLTMKAVSGLFRPSRVFEWKDLEGPVNDFFAEMYKSVASKLGEPMVVQELDSKPAIYGLDATTVNGLPGQIIPTFQYVSKYKNSQSDLIMEEANQMAPHMEKYFEGVNDLGANLLFVAYEEPPIDPKKKYKTYRTVVEIK